MYVCVVQIWPDNAVRREIGNLKVKCENCKVGCGWKGLFKELKVCPITIVTFAQVYILAFHLYIFIQECLLDRC